MGMEHIVQTIDQEIARLQQVRNILTERSTPTTQAPKRVFSMASRRKMAMAQRARWAAKKAGQRRGGGGIRPIVNEGA